MEYIYAAMILHSAEKDINEENVKGIIEAAGIDADDARMLAIASAIADTEGAIDEELAEKLSNVAVAAAPVVEEEVVEEEEEEEEEENSEEEAAAGLGALFG